MSERHRIPLLEDHHSHPSVYAAMATCVDLRRVERKPEALELIRERDEELVFVLGWNDSLYSLEPGDLERLPPVFICNTSLHNYLANEEARRLLSESHPEVVANLDDQDWIERNLPAIFKLIVALRGGDVETLTAFYDDLLAQGIWYAEDMLLPNSGVLDTIEAAGLADRTLVWADPETYAGLDEEHRARVHGIKLFTDGALGARTAAMVEPLMSGETGLLLWDEEELHRTLVELSHLGKPVAMHAIGDRASAQVLDALEGAERDGPGLPPIRIEHAEFMTLDQAHRAKSLGVVLSMQPNFSVETDTYADRLTPEQCARINPFRMLIDEAGFVPGEDLLLGSDGMPHGAEFALRSSFFPPLASQRLTLEEFVAGYCVGNMEAGWIEVEIGDDGVELRVES